MPPLFFDVTTTAAYTGTVRMCLDFTGTTYQNPPTVRFFHRENGEWVDRTIPGSLDLARNIVCARVTSLSPFALGALLDTTPPTTSATATANGGPSAVGTWTNGNVAVTLTAADNAGGAGVASITYAASGATTIANTTVNGASVSLTVTAEGTTTITFFAEDNAGNKESARIFTVRIDKTRPTLGGAATTGPNAEGWYRADVLVAWTCSDNTGGSGIDGACPPTSTIAGEGTALTASATVGDKAGNSATATSPPVKIDRTAPVTTATPSATANAAGWFNKDLTVTLAATDALVGVARTEYNLDNAG
jgi:hypothetical protein